MDAVADDVTVLLVDARFNWDSACSGLSLAMVRGLSARYRGEASIVVVESHSSCGSFKAVSREVHRKPRPTYSRAEFNIHLS